MGGSKLYIKYGSAPGFPKPADMPQPEEFELKDENREGDGVLEQFLHFVKVLDGTEKPYPDGYTARQCVQVMEAANRSGVARRVIDIREL